MKESDLLAHIQRRSANLADTFGQVVVGPGDDCAVIRTPAGDQFLLTVDHLVEGRHFEPGTPIDLIARKAIARSVSDIAAMGGTPAWSLATGCLPPGYPHGNALFEAMHKWAGHWGCPIVGGDIASSDGPLVLTVTVGGVMGLATTTQWADVPGIWGVKPSDVRPVLRSGARPGDAVWVTGALGGSLRSGRHLTFEPRLAQGQLAAFNQFDIRAMIDISDGLGRDAGRIARASGVVLELDARLIPLAPEAASWLDAARDGEDYELLMVGAHAPPGLTRIGSARAPAPGEPPAVWMTDPYGQRHDIGDMGWDHG